MIRSVALLAFAILSSVHTSALGDDRLSSWVMVPGLTLSQIYFDAAISLDKAKNRPDYDVSVVGTSALPWPDGRSLLITTLEVFEREGQAKWLFRCVDSKDAYFVDTGETCYQLKQP